MDNAIFAIFDANRARIARDRARFCGSWDRLFYLLLLEQIFPRTFKFFVNFHNNMIDDPSKKNFH